MCARPLQVLGRPLVTSSNHVAPVSVVLESCAKGRMWTDLDEDHTLTRYVLKRTARMSGCPPCVKSLRHTPGFLL